MPRISRRWWLVGVLVSIGIGTLAGARDTRAAAQARAATARPPEELAHYTYRPASRDGIGKIYMGREISFVMGHRGAAWLERAEREVEERPDLVLQELGLEADHVVADVGAGSGYFSFRLSRLVPRGRVLAVDVQPEMLTVIRKRSRELGVDNVEPVLGLIDDPNLPAATVDVALMVDAYHEFSHPREMMEGLVEALVPGGRVFLVEYRGEDPNIPILPLHKMTVRQARRELEAVGLVFVENRTGLPVQHVMVFRKLADG